MSQKRASLELMRKLRRLVPTLSGTVTLCYFHFAAFLLITVFQVNRPHKYRNHKYLLQSLLFYMLWFKFINCAIHFVLLILFVVLSSGDEDLAPDYSQTLGSFTKQFYTGMFFFITSPCNIWYGHNNFIMMGKNFLLNWLHL